MSTPLEGRIELERAVDSIIVGARHRHDHGDLTPLVESIRRHGLLQPITVTLDGHLICGARRLAAIKLLGIKTVNVWVRSGVSDRLGQLLAEQDDNQLHKPLTQLEAAALYRELKALLAEDAARRQEATRFQTSAEDAEDGGANLAPPQIEQGKTRAQAARMVTGRASYTTLERIGRLEDLAADESQPEAVRARAAQEIERIKTGGSVYPSHLRVNAELSLAGWTSSPPTWHSPPGCASGPVPKRMRCGPRSGRRRPQSWSSWRSPRSPASRQPRPAGRRSGPH
ncbi:ParB N-terminal domain-containing protein [Salana multivorans]